MTAKHPPSSRSDAITRVSNNTAVGPARPEAGVASACLVVISGANIGRKIALDRDRVTFGRTPGGGVALDDERASREHARIDREPGGFTLRDLGSTNGTFVNEQRVAVRTLRDGDRVGVGQHVLKFLDRGNVEADYHEELFRLMSFDGLTDVFNKRYFEEQLNADLRGEAAVVSVVVFDCDHFKRVNDTHGHAAGDAVLRQLAGLAREVFTGVGTLARVGGEEFAVVLAGIDRGGAFALADRLRERVAEHIFEGESGRIDVSLSLGVTESRRPPKESRDVVFARADAALYRAKQAGRNRTVYG